MNHNYYAQNNFGLSNNVVNNASPNVNMGNSFKPNFYGEINRNPHVANNATPNFPMANSFKPNFYVENNRHPHVVNNASPNLNMGNSFKSNFNVGNNRNSHVVNNATPNWNMGNSFKSNFNVGNSRNSHLVNNATPNFHMANSFKPSVENNSEADVANNASPNSYMKNSFKPNFYVESDKNFDVVDNASSNLNMGNSLKPNFNVGNNRNPHVANNATPNFHMVNSFKPNCYVENSRNLHVVNNATPNFHMANSFKPNFYVENNSNVEVANNASPNSYMENSFRANFNEGNSHNAHVVNNATPNFHIANSFKPNSYMETNASSNLFAENRFKPNFNVGQNSNFHVVNSATPNVHMANSLKPNFYVENNNNLGVVNNTSLNLNMKNSFAPNFYVENTVDEDYNMSDSTTTSPTKPTHPTDLSDKNLVQTTNNHSSIHSVHQGVERILQSKSPKTTLGPATQTMLNDSMPQTKAHPMVDLSHQNLVHAKNNQSGIHSVHLGVEHKLQSKSPKTTLSPVTQTMRNDSMSRTKTHSMVDLSHRNLVHAKNNHSSIHSVHLGVEHKLQSKSSMTKLNPVKQTMSGTETHSMVDLSHRNLIQKNQSSIHSVRQDMQHKLQSRTTLSPTTKTMQNLTTEVDLSHLESVKIDKPTSSCNRPIPKETEHLELQSTSTTMTELSSCLTKVEPTYNISPKQCHSSHLVGSRIVSSQQRHILSEDLAIEPALPVVYEYNISLDGYVSADDGVKHVRTIFRTKEYDENRAKNNAASKRCRLKRRQKEIEAKRRLHEAEERNRRIHAELDMKYKELSELEYMIALIDGEVEPGDDDWVDTEE